MRRLHAKEGKMKASNPPKSLSKSIGMKQDAQSTATPTVGKSKGGKKRKGPR